MFGSLDIIGAAVLELVDEVFHIAYGSLADLFT